MKNNYLPKLAFETTENNVIVGVFLIVKTLNIDVPSNDLSPSHTRLASNHHRWEVQAASAT
jgi:hypothetical protein